MAKLFKKPIFVSISPNAQKDDVWLAFKLIFSPWKWTRPLIQNLDVVIKNGAVHKFTNELKNYFGLKYIFTFDSGRTSLYAILRALNFGNGDEVLVQAFTCTAAVNPILWVGAAPVYVDILKDTYNMSPSDLEKKITPKSKAIIVQHTFGLPAQIDKISKIAKKNNLILLEDVAHSFGAEYLNKKLGTWGDAAFFSFGRFKIISAVFAGAAGTNNPEIGEKLRKFYEEQSEPSRFWIFQQLFHPIILAFAKPFYNIFSLGKFAVIIVKKLKLISLSVYSEEKSGGKPDFGPSRMPDSLAELGLNQFKKTEKFNEYRRELSTIYFEELKNCEKIILPKVLDGAKPVFLYFPILLKGGDLDYYKLIGWGRRKEGIYLENWPAKKVIGPKGVDLEKLKYIAGSCPVAEEAAKRIVVLPTNPNTSEKDAQRVCEFIKKALK
ncbi:aminotransferase class V-fold PLP-dependent enzyme [Candidatus Wolfebacteria bacterium]|nr:aminotransferase class V-fold PLP-dependent enzyme [Candidatus Wolfebacteria bacterium]